MVLATNKGANMYNMAGFITGVISIAASGAFSVLALQNVNLFSYGMLACSFCLLALGAQSVLHFGKRF